MLAQPRALIPFGLERRRNWKYLLDVEFAVNASAPLTSYEGEVGRLDVIDTTGVWSVTGGELVPGGSTNATGDPGYVTPVPFAARAGLGVAQRFKLAAAAAGSAWSATIGFNNSNVIGSAGLGIQLLNTAPFRANDNNVVLGEPLALDSYTTVTIVVRAGGGYFAFVNNHLVWLSEKIVSGELYAGFRPGGAGNKAPHIDYVRVKDFGAPFDSAFGIALLHTASVSGSDYTAAADVIADLVVNAPALLAGTAGLRVRKSGNDYWQVNFNSSGQLIVQRYASGVAQGSAVTLASSVISGSAAVTLRVIASESHLDFYTLAGTTWTKRGSQQTDSVLSANTGVMPFADSSWTSGGGSVGQLDAYARADAVYAVLDGA